MTAESAIIELNNLKNDTPNSETIKRQNEAIELAKGALRLQMKRGILWGKSFPFAFCSNCKSEFNSELISEYNITNCPWCGQAIDRSELSC